MRRFGRAVSDDDLALADWRASGGLSSPKWELDGHEDFWTTYAI